MASRKFTKYPRTSKPCYELDDRGFAELSSSDDRDCYDGLRISNTDYSNLPEDVRDRLNEYGLPRAEDENFHTFVDVGERFDLVSDSDKQFFAEHGICKDSKKFENVVMYDNW